jgi:hypothetical protein
MQRMKIFARIAVVFASRRASFALRDRFDSHLFDGAR